MPNDVAVTIAEGVSGEGGRFLFGVTGGGANLDLIGAAEDLGIRFVLTHAEDAAAIMAGAYGVVSGTLGAALGTRGPGTANAVNGIAHCWLDHEPMVFVSD